MGPTAPTMPATTEEIRKLRLMVAVKTPYSEDGNIDLEAFDLHVEFLINNGVEALIIGGTTGEGHLFSWEEHLVLIAHAKTQFKGRVLIVGNTGSNCTSEQNNATKKGFAIGMDCSLLINPYYGKTSPKGILMHLEHGLKFGPAIIYNVPSRTGQDMPLELLSKISGHQNFVGVKECMGVERCKNLVDAGMKVWSGNDDLCHAERHDSGIMGSISVAGNVVPGLMRKLMDERNEELNASLQPLFKWLFTEPNPIGLNTMLMMLGVAKPVNRLPYTNRDLEAREAGIEIINTVGLANFPVGPNGLKVMDESQFQFTLSGE